jgi:hypothetical protein
LPAHQLLQLVRPEAGAVVLDELARPGIVTAAHLLALLAVVDGRVEVGVDLEQQRIRAVGVEGDDVLVLDLDVVRPGQARDRRVESA